MPSMKLQTSTAGIYVRVHNFEIYREALNGFLEIEPRTRQKAYVHYRIGRMFYDGYGTDIDYEKAFKWLKKPPTKVIIFRNL